MKPYLNSKNLIDAISRKISLPTSQNIFSEEDFLKFLNEEMFSNQVPSILQYHEEYFVYSKEVKIESKKRKYEIPSRAIGLKLRDLLLKKGNSLFRMIRISPENETENLNFQENFYFIENNHVVLSPSFNFSNDCYLIFKFYMRPNNLVKIERAAFIKNFVKKITVNNSGLIVGNHIKIDNTTITAGVDFTIGTNSNITASNLAIAIGNVGYTTTVTTNEVSIFYKKLNTTFESNNSSSLSISNYQHIEFENIPNNITNGSYIDFLKTEPGHQILNYDVLIENNAISANIVKFNQDDIPSELSVGDYMCLKYECIIPMIPPDLHNLLAERAASKILTAIGDKEGALFIDNNVKQMEMKQSSIIDNRIDSHPKRIINYNSILRLKK